MFHQGRGRSFLAMPTLMKSKATVASILAAARKLFLERSYAEVTTQQIARAALLTKGALYHHFSSKEELYLALLHADLDAKRELFERAVARPGTARERLARFTSDFFALEPEERELIKLVRRDINIFRSPQRAELVRAYQRTLPEQVEIIIRDGIRDGELPAADPRLLSWHFVAMVEVILAPYASTLFADDAAKIDHVLNMFFSGNHQAQSA
jgi:AcrR family transcriptional regulator